MKALYQSIRLFFHKVGHWEYWPIWIVYFPCFFVYPYYALKSKSSLFFTVANPGIKYSGAFLSSKDQINQKLPADLLPNTLYVAEGTKIEHCINFIDQRGLKFPVILKPDYGLRGKGIVILKNAAELASFIERNTTPYLLQEFIAYKNEIGVFVIRNESGRLEISSIVKRKFMNLQGDGKRTIEELILSNPRYTMQLQWLIAHNYIDPTKVLEDGEALELVKIGNHSRGTIFRDANELKQEALSSVMNSIFDSFTDFNYGRLDIKYKSLDDLLMGKNFKIMELNGVYSEPAHIYDPDYKLVEAWKVLLEHFKALYRVSTYSIQKGHQPLSFITGLRKIREHFVLVNRI